VAGRSSQWRRRSAISIPGIEVHERRRQRKLEQKSPAIAADGVATYEVAEHGEHDENCRGARLGVARCPRQAVGQQGQQRVEVDLHHQRPHRAIHRPYRAAGEVLAERQETPPLAGGAAVLLNQQQHDDRGDIEWDDPQDPVDRVATHVDRSGPGESPAHERPEQEIAGEAEEHEHAEAAPE
jgi:hypothetical protein